MAQFHLFNQLSGIHRRLRAKSNKISVWMLPGEKTGYIPVPKVASSSIRKSIRALAAREYFPQSHYLDKATKEKIDAKVKRSLTPREAEKLGSESFLFSFVRNPITRLYSCYRDKVVNAENRRDRCTLSHYGIEFGISFDDFIHLVAELPDSQSNQHFRSQHTFLMHKEEMLVDFTGKIENMAQDWKQILEKVGFPLPAREHRVSGPPVKLCELPLTRTSAEKLIARYETDIQCFGYQKETEALLESLK